MIESNFKFGHVIQINIKYFGIINWQLQTCYMKTFFPLYMDTLKTILTLFFFFLRIHPDVIKNHSGYSAITKEENSGGAASIQTIKGKENLALLAEVWATEFPCLLTWEKEWALKEFEIDWMSLTKWSWKEGWGVANDTALNTISESPWKYNNLIEVIKSKCHVWTWHTSWSAKHI